MAAGTRFPIARHERISMVESGHGRWFRPPTFSELASESRVLFNDVTRSSHDSSRIHHTLRDEQSPVLTEACMMDYFEADLQARWCYHASARPVLIRELEGLQGRADLVVAHVDMHALPDGADLKDLATSLSSATKARILSVLKYRAPRTVAYLKRLTGLSHRSLAKHTRQLSTAGIVELHSNSSVSLACRLPWNMVDIIAYEGKIANIRRALHQAIGYRSFSRSVLIVMPESGAQRAKRLATIFDNNGIGLISLREDGSPRTEIRGRKHRRPASRRLYLMAVGAVLTKLVEEDCHSDTNIKPELP